MMTEILTATAVSQMVKSFVKKVVTPKVVKISKKLDITLDDLLIPRGEHFEIYLNRMYEKYSSINTLVFHNSQRKLKEVYVAQTLVKKSYAGEYKETAVIDELPVPLIKRYKKILIRDTAGMGKSTIMKRMFIDLLDQGRSDVGIPLYIELNRLSKNHPILQEILEGLNSLSENFDPDRLSRFIQEGGFIFFLDGLDEVPIADKGEVIYDIQTFISKAGSNNYFILTSRPEDNLTSFGDFQLFNIQPLEKKEAFELLRNYDMSEKKKLSNSLIGLLQSGEYDAIDEYLVNPLLVSLLYTAYDFNRSIPLEKHRFYEKVFEAYFEKHDFSKPIKPREKFSGLNYDGFSRVLRKVGFDCLIELGVKFSGNLILNTLRNAKNFCVNLNFSESDLLKDLITSVPLFCQEGIDYKWVHKSLLEFFAANFIFCDAKEKQDIILSAIYRSEHFEKYINMLDIYYSIDFKGFSKNITLPICEDYLKFHKDSMQSNRYEKLNSKISKKLVEERIALLYLNDFAFMHCRIGYKYKDVNSSFKKDRFPIPQTMKFPDNERTNKYLFVSTKPHKHISQLLSFLSCKIKILENKNVNLTPVVFQKIENYFLKDKVYVADLCTGDKDEKTYNAVNTIMCAINQLILDGNACGKEAERIKNDLAQNDISNMTLKI